MKLLSCHIENFGKLKDFTYYFEDDLNVLFAENGWGKSTFAAFLVVMFYGFDGENRRNEDGNERLRYRPWGGGVYGGSVTWSSGSKTYRMMRIFGARKKDDKFSLYDDATGFICSDYSDRIGEELFAIDRDSFCRTVFWSQSDHETSATTSIQAKIGDLSAQPDDLPAYDAAVKRLRREAERLRPDRSSGLIRKKEDRLTILEADQARLPALTAQLEECASKEQELTRELNQIRSEKQQYALSVPQNSEQTAVQKRMESSPESLSAARSGLSSARSGLISAESKLSSLKSARRRTIARGQKVREQYVQVKRDLRRELEASAILKKKRLGRIRAASAAGILLSVILFALCFAGVLPRPLLVLPVLLLAASGWALWYSGRSTGSDDGSVFPAAESENILLLEEEKERYRVSLRALQRKLARIEEQIRAQQILCERLRSKIQKLESAAYADGGAESAGMHSGSAGMHSESAGMRPESAGMRPESAGMRPEFAGMRPEFAGIKSAGGGSIPSAVARTLSDFDVREEECRSQLQETRQQSEELRGMIRDCRASQETIPSLQSEIRDLREQYDTCTKTLSYLEEARNLFTSRYMNPFLRSFRRYYGMLTGQSAESVQTDADLGIMIMDEGLPRDPSLMSEGTRDMISLCRRMAMIDAMYPGEKPFLVLDDPFSNLDDERLKGGMRFLHTASLEYQILYLTCHGSRL